MKQLTQPIALILLSILFFYSCNESKKKENSTDVVVEEDLNIQIGKLAILKADSIMSLDDKSLGQLAGAIHYYNIGASSDISHVNKKLLEIENEYNLKSDGVLVLTKTIGSNINVKQVSAGTAKEINGIQHYFQPYVINKTFNTLNNVVYKDNQFEIRNIRETDEFYATRTIIRLSKIDYRYVYLNDNDYNLPHTILPLNENETSRDTLITYIENNITQLIPAKILADSSIIIEPFHKRTTYHYHAPCRTQTQPNIDSSAIASNRIIKITETGTLKDKTFKMIITPPDCIRVAENNLKTKNFNVQLVELYYYDGLKKVVIDTIAHNPNL